MKLIIEEIPLETVAIPQSRIECSFIHNGIEHMTFEFFPGHGNDSMVRHQVALMLRWKEELIEMLGDMKWDS